MKADYKYYAFISYKHEDDKGQFKEDAAWAEALDDELRFLHIPVEISREELIRETDDSVNPVFRDDTNLPMTKEGELQKALKKKLKSSKTLVLILSRSMVQDQNKKYSRDKEKNEAWVYWEVMTFLELHNYDWGRIIPVFIEKERYSPSSIGTAINMEKKYSNIQKPWQDYGTKYDWDNDRQSFYRRVACDVASAIFKVEDKEAFWNVKEKAREAEEAERKENEAQLQLRDMKLKKNRAQKFMLALGILAAVLVGALIYSRSRRVQSMELTAKGWTVLESGNRREALDYARAAHRKWKGNQETKQLMWVASDSTMSYMCVNSPVSFSRNDSLFVYIDKNKYAVVMDAKTLQEVDRIETGKACAALISPEGNRIAVLNTDNYYTLYDRNDRSSILADGYANKIDDGLWNESGSIMFVRNRLNMSSGCYYLGVKTGERSSTVKFSDISFMGTDSLIALIPKLDNQEQTYCRFYLYDLKEGTRERDWINQTAELAFPNGITSVAFSRHNRLVVASSRDSIYTFLIDKSEGNYLLKRRNVEALKVPIKSISFKDVEDAAFVVDEEGTGCLYDVTGRVRPALAYAYMGDIRSMSKNYRAICKTIDYSSLYYLKDKFDINLTDGKFTGFHLPNTGVDLDVNGSRHGGVYAIMVTESGKDALEGCKTYLYTIGVGRTLAPKSTWKMLSSEYVVRGGMDLFISKSEDGRSSSTHSSSCIFNPITGEHIMHLAKREDAEQWKDPHVVFEDYYLNGHRLVARCKNGDIDYLLRVYDLKERVMNHEIHVGRECRFITWFNDGSFLYAEGTFLYRLNANAGAEPIVVSDCFDGIYYNDNPTGDCIVINEKHSGEIVPCWVSARDGLVRQLTPHHVRELSPDGNYILYGTDKFWSHRQENGEWKDYQESKFSVLDSRTLDTLSVISSDQIITNFYRYSLDSKHLIFSEGKEWLCCVGIPSGKERWRKKIWRPVTITMGKKYMAVQSTSLFVLDIKTGKTVCEFETGLKKLKLTLSPDEQWLLAGDKLYSIPIRQKMASGVDERYIRLEDNYLVYSRYLMKLPSAGDLFD